MCFPVNIAKYLRTPILKNIYKRTASVNSRSAIFRKSLVSPFKLNTLASRISWHTRIQIWQLRHSWELNLLCWDSGSRSSCPNMFCKKGVLRNFAKFTGKYLCQSLFFNKVFKKVTLVQVLYSEFCKVSESTFFTEHLWWLLLWFILVASIAVTWLSWFSGRLE